MARQRQREQTIWFPWERRGGLIRRTGLARARPFAVALAMALFVLFLGARERRRTGIRSTQATLSQLHGAIDAYRADHEKKCPPTLAALKAEGYLPSEPQKPGEAASTPSAPSAPSGPVDAWGRPFRLTCPGRKDPEGYDLMSDGPEGEMGALSRVE
jgi:general secretion pathway protein G